MRVGINARMLASPDVRGFNRYTGELVRALAATGRVDLVLFSNVPIDPGHGFEGIPAVTAAVRPQLRWQHRWLPQALRRERIELFHAPAHWGVPWRSPCPVVATIHDVFDRELPHLKPAASFRVSTRHELEQQLIVRRARRIITVSQASARSIERHLGVAPERIAVTVEGAAPIFDRPVAPERVAAAREALGVRGLFFLYVGGFEVRKNLPALVGALASLAVEERPYVVCVGDGGAAAEALGLAALQAGVADRLVLAGGTSDARLAELYAGALAVVLPSWLEGFGLPVVEAMHMGTPSIVSTGGSLPEVAGDAALIFPPEDPAALGAAMRRLLTEPPLREELADRARERAGLFTWARAAEQTIRVYEEAAAGAPPRP